MQFEYFNARLLQNTALKIKQTVGAVTPPDGYAFGVLSALTNLEITNSDLVENVNSVYVNTLDIKIPTEETMAEYVFEHVTVKRDSVIIKSNTMPAATAELLGYEYQYMGETNNTYTHGFVYECKEIPVDTLVFTPNTVSCDWAGLSAFLQTETADYNSVVAGSMTYFADAELWRATFTDANGDTVLTYQQYTGGWENIGFVFSQTFEDGDVVSFVRYTESDYVWERIDLQPGGAAQVIDVKVNGTSVVENNVADINVPTKTSNLTNDSGFITNSAVGNGTITITQGGTTKGTFTTNQSGNTTIDIDAGVAQYVSNCITEIPQDIKLELHNGTLTLKAGSKVYVPNGVGVFNKITTSADFTPTATGLGTANIFVSVLADGSNCAVIKESVATSGTSAPSGVGVWWDTTNNLIKGYASGSDTGRRHSLPVALVHCTNGVWDYIVDVFNGIGYFGSTVFALPNTQGLIPNGFNADCTLKNTEWTTASVITRTMATDDNITNVLIGTDGTQFKRASANDTSYNKNQNLVMHSSDDWAVSLVASCTLTAGKISNWNAKTVFHAVDYSDTRFIANQAMPSDKHINLTLGASDTSYTAPADGWFSIAKMSTDTGQRIQMFCAITGLNTSATAAASGNNVRCFLPVKKNDIVKIIYDTSGSLAYFYFIYAKGAQ